MTAIGGMPQPKVKLGGGGEAHTIAGSAVLAGARGAAVDRDALHTAVRHVGDLLAAHPHIREIDCNPVLARPDSALAVDWKVSVT